MHDHGLLQRPALAFCLCAEGPPYAGRGADPLVSALLLKMHQDDAKDTGSGSVHGSMVGGAADGDGGGAKNEGVSIARLHAMLVCQSSAVLTGTSCRGARHRRKRLRPAAMKICLTSRMLSLSRSEATPPA